MRSDNVYVPLNGKLPASRLLKIIDDAGIETVLIDVSTPVSENISSALSQLKGLKIIVSGAAECSDAAARAFVAAPTDDPASATRLAYILYTSGSTGIPKGVAITRESACCCIEKLHRMFGTSEHDRFTQFSALTFDVSIADIFLCWKSGGTLYVPPDSDSLLPLSFASLHQLTVWSSVPSLASFSWKLKLLRRNALSHLRLSLFAGEALPIELIRAWADAAPNSRLFNLYGPTECTIFSTFHEYDRSETTSHGVVPIGEPLDGLRALIISDDAVVDQDGDPGELWLSGDQLASSYWNNPKATSAAFIRHPRADPAAAVWYRTGDLVSRHDGKGLVFRGRLDRQVKLRGFRVELQEVESALRAAAGCTLAAVVPLKGIGGICEKLIAFCDSLGSDEATIKSRCLNRIPSYMVPERIVQLKNMPLSVHGKIDYLALTEITQAQFGQGPASEVSLTE